MDNNLKSIPIIDINALVSKCDNPNAIQDEDVLEVIGNLDKACREAGFFYVKGHGIPDSLIKSARDATRCFFNLPCEEKMKIKLSANSGYRGYQGIGVNITKGKPDIHEAIDLYREITNGMYDKYGTTLEGCNPWPERPLNFKPLMEEYITRLKDLSRKIMRGIALALGGSADTFEGDRAGDPFWVMRLIGYPSPTILDMQNNKFNGLSCGAHTDYGMLTLLNQDDNVDALQVRNQAGEWIHVPPIPGTFVCNIGDMLKIFTNGEYESTLHRVINNSSLYRVSVAFFYETNFDTPVEPLEVCKKRTGGVAKFQKVVYGEHLLQKVLTNFVNV